MRSIALHVIHLICRVYGVFSATPSLGIFSVIPEFSELPHMVSDSLELRGGEVWPGGWYRLHGKKKDFGAVELMCDFWEH